MRTKREKEKKTSEKNFCKLRFVLSPGGSEKIYANPNARRAEGNVKVI
jgi:hypothetical protein